MKRPTKSSSVAAPYLTFAAMFLATVFALPATAQRGGPAAGTGGITMSSGCSALPDPRGGGFSCGPASSGEIADYNAFIGESYVDKRIQLGEDFEKNYPKSRYVEPVDEALAILYYNRRNWAKFYAAADRVFVENPNDLVVLRLAGWVIPLRYDPSDPAGAAQLSKAEKYEKRALAIVGSMKKAKDQTDDDFSHQKATEESQIHSGLGITYFRRKDYDDSASELQLAVQDETPQPSPEDLYVLGVDLQALNRTDEAVATFTKCATISDDLRARCQMAAKSPAEEAAYATLLNEPDAETRIALSEQFEASYPKSDYREAVNIELLHQYQRKQDLPKFYAAADRVTAIDQNDQDVLVLVAWVTSRNPSASGADASARLNQAATYAARALELIPSMQPKPDQSAGDFTASKAALTAQAHSALGTIDFLRNDFANSAAELQLATTQSPSPDPQDFYTLGLAWQKLGRNSDAADAFAKCGKLPGIFATQCKQSAEGVHAQN